MHHCFDCFLRFIGFPMSLITTYIFCLSSIVSFIRSRFLLSLFSHFPSYAHFLAPINILPFSSYHTYRVAPFLWTVSSLTPPLTPALRSRQVRSRRRCRRAAAELCPRRAPCYLTPPLTPALRPPQVRSRRRCRRAAAEPCPRRAPCSVPLSPPPPALPR